MDWGLVTVGFVHQVTADSDPAGSSSFLVQKHGPKDEPPISETHLWTFDAKKIERVAGK